MLSDSAKVKLDLAEALLMLGRLDEVEALCVFLVAYFRNAEMVTGALTAAAFLKEAAARRKLTREHVQYVRRYLAALERTPDLVFAPPPAVP